MQIQGARVAIIGGGPAGMSAAWALARRGASVAVFEREMWLGGRTRTDLLDGFRIDAGTQLFGSPFRHLLAVLEEIGAQDLAVATPGRDALLRRGRVHEVVYGSMASMLAWGGLGLATKLRLGSSYQPFLQRHATGLNPYQPEAAAAAGLDAISAGVWGAREFGSEFVEHLVEPPLAAFHGLAADETSAAFFHMLARSGQSASVFALRGGSATFCVALADRLRGTGAEIRTGAAVHRIARVAGGILLATGDQAERFDAVVVATPAPGAAELVADALPEAARWLGGLGYRPAVSLALLLDRASSVRYFGLSLPRAESRVLAALCVGENKLPDRVPAGRGLLTALPRPETQAQLWGAAPETIIDTLLPEIRRVIPAIDGQILRARAYTWRDGWTIFPPGRCAELGRVRDGSWLRDPRIAFAGDYLYLPNIEGAVYAGLRAAERLADAGH